MDSFAVKQLVKLEEKVPSIKTETEDVLEALDERKKAVTTRINNGKDAITTRLATGKEAIATSIHSGKDALVSALQASSDAVANSGPGSLVGSGVNHTLKVTENIVDYLLPDAGEDEGVSFDAGKEEVKVETKTTVDEEASSDEEDGEQEEEKGKDGESNVERVKNISRKVKLRVYYRTLRRLDTVQQQCKSTLEQLKMNVDLVSFTTMCICTWQRQQRCICDCYVNYSKVLV